MKTGVGSLQDGQVIEGKDLRPCHTEYPPLSASAATSTSYRFGQAASGDPGRHCPAWRAAVDAGRLEAEITEFLGRDRYQRAAACDDVRPGSRNGYREVTVKTTAGPVQLARPKLRGTAEAFASRLFGSYVTKTNALESLVIASFVRGLSAATWKRRSPRRWVIRPRSVSPRCRRSAARSRTSTRPGRGAAWTESPWTTCSWTPRFPDAPRLPGRAGPGCLGHHHQRQARVHRPGPGSGKSADAWADFLADLTDRGLPCPLLVISDGARGLISCDRAGLPRGPAPALPDPPKP
jgi:putative transposase